MGISKIQDRKKIEFKVDSRLTGRKLFYTR